MAGVLLIDHEVRKTDFQQVPYHRIFIMLFLELNSPDPILENINYQVRGIAEDDLFLQKNPFSRSTIKIILIFQQVLTAYCNMLHILRPAKAPGFAYAWLEIVSHRVFMGRILASTPQQKVRSSIHSFIHLNSLIHSFIHLA